MLPSWGVPIVWATILVDIVILVTAEITPKTLSLSSPTTSSMRIVRLLDIAARVLAPAIWLFTYLPSRLLNIDRIFEASRSEVITESQIVHMIDLGAREGAIETSEGERAVRVFEFADTTVEEVMTPRADLVHLTLGDSLREALHMVNASGFSRLPVLTPDGNDSPGFLAAKDLLRLDQEGRLDEPVDGHLRPIAFVPETKRILELLQEFRSRGVASPAEGRVGGQVALVVNEFGTITGLVTLEDLLEEVLGEIYDEYDRDDLDAEWVSGSLVVPGSFPAEALAERLNVKPPEGDYDTAAGLFLHLLGRVPQPGERVELAGEPQPAEASSRPSGEGAWDLIATHVVRQRITRLVARRGRPAEGTSPHGPEIRGETENDSP